VLCNTVLNTDLYVKPKPQHPYLFEGHVFKYECVVEVTFFDSCRPILVVIVEKNARKEL
jgi:hypothetical protein